MSADSFADLLQLASRRWSALEDPWPADQEPPTIAAPPSRELGWVVVIPLVAPVDPFPLLASLWQGIRPPEDAEVILVPHAPRSAPVEVFQHHRFILGRFDQWLAGHWDPRLPFLTLYRPNRLPPTAGLADTLRMGMIEAAWRLHAVGRPEGGVIGLPADRVVAPDFLVQASRCLADPVDPSGESWPSGVVVQRESGVLIGGNQFGMARPPQK